MLTVSIFVIAYILIALEHPIKINKAAVALIAAGLLWMVHIYQAPEGIEWVQHQLTEKLAETASIVFFLIGAMTIVEVTDAHGGFDVITSRIRTKKLSVLLWIIALVTFFLSAILDNMTTAIVMVTLVKKFLKNDKQRFLFLGIIVIAANAGGAWTPIGDVTTTMLWIGGQITAMTIMQSLFLPSLICMLIPVTVCSFIVKGPVIPPDASNTTEGTPNTSNAEKNIMFILGMGALIFVPVFKSVTHLPPYLGILYALGVVWFIGEILHRNKTEEEKEHLTLSKALRRIDMTSVVFFIGILLAVSVLSVNGQLPALAGWLDSHIPSKALIVFLIGIVSALVDNIPIVAASMGMYPLSQYPQDSFIWEFLAYCAGTGGSILIIGSAAGVASMGLEKIHFFWYVRKISFLAFIGYAAGALIYILQYKWTHGHL